MAQRPYRLYGTGAGSANDVATIDIPRRGRIKGIQWSVALTGADALDDGFHIEVSMTGAEEIRLNDARQSLLVVTTVQSFLTSGGGGSYDNGFVPMDFDIEEGDRVHLHAVLVGSAGPTYFAHFTLWLELAR